MLGACVIAGLFVMGASGGDGQHGRGVDGPDHFQLWNVFRDVSVSPQREPTIVASF